MKYYTLLLFKEKLYADSMNVTKRLKEENVLKLNNKVTTKTWSIILKLCVFPIIYYTIISHIRIYCIIGTIALF